MASPVLPQGVQARNILLEPKAPLAQRPKDALDMLGQIAGHHGQHIVLHPGLLQQAGRP